MALVNPFLLPTKTLHSLHVSAPPSKLLRTFSSFNFKPALLSRRKQAVCGAIADIKDTPLLDGEEDQRVLVGPSSARERVVVDYDWTEEWYPLYLTQNVPEDAPLGLKVFDKDLVLFKNADGQFRCYEDRCPHRLLDSVTSILHDPIS